MRRLISGTLMALAFAATAHARPIDRDIKRGNCELVTVRGGGVVQEFSCATTSDFWDDMAWRIRQSPNKLRIDTVYRDPRTGHWFVVFHDNL